MNAAPEGRQLSASMRHGISETLWRECNIRSHEGANGTGGGGRRQGPDPPRADPAKAGNRDADGAGEPVPAKRPKRAPARMARGGEGRAEEDEIGAGARGAHELHPIMRRGGEQPRAPANARAAAAADVQARTKEGGEARVAGDHQGEAAGAAEPGEIAPERAPLWRTIMAQHDAGEPDGQKGDGGAGIGQAGFVGEEPERRQGAPPRPRGTACLDRARPGDELPIHVR